MNNQPLVSIITVVLNDRHGLEQTLRSVQSQTYRHIEYIVVDGGSTDGTQEVLRMHGDSVQRWISEPDKGIGDAFNKGIAMATGEIVGILNAGDRYQFDTVETIIHEYLKCTDRSSFFCSGNMRVNEWDVVLKADPGYARKIPFMMPLINHPTCFVAADIYRRVGGFALNIAIAMDYEFLKRCHKSGISIQCLDKILVEIDSYGISDRRFWTGYRELLKYSDNKLFTLLIGPLMLYNRLRLAEKKRRRQTVPTSKAAR